MAVYDIGGNVILNEGTVPENIKANMALLHGYDSTADTRYTILRVFKQKVDGTLQYPFVRKANSDGTSRNAIELRCIEGWNLIFNAGVGEGLVIQNSVVITDQTPVVHAGAMPLTINANGDLSFTDTDTTGKGEQLVSQGIVSAVCGFFPIIDNYDRYNYPTDIPGTDTEQWIHAQRQVIGQYSNGDYAIITGEGRGFADSVGFSIPDVQELCLRLGLKFAYNLDGGGSTQTLLDNKSVNTIYENETGRRMPVYLVFNGSTTYSIPPI